MTPAARWCANGDECCSVPALGGPARLSRSNTDTLCFACRERRIDEQLAPPTGRSFSMTEAAELLGVRRWRVEYLVTTGQLRARKAGADGRLQIVESDLERVAQAG